MCLGVPGQVIEWLDHDPILGRASIEFDGVRRVCHMACVPDAEIGEYVVVHAGIAISRIDPDAARRAIEELKELGLDEELDAGYGQPINEPPQSARAADKDNGEASP